MGAGARWPEITLLEKSRDPQADKESWNLQTDRKLGDKVLSSRQRYMGKCGNLLCLLLLVLSDKKSSSCMAAMTLLT